jgi:hypothetical protein
MAIEVTVKIVVVRRDSRCLRDAELINHIRWCHFCLNS